MEQASIQVEGMSCEHCVQAITKALRALPGVADVAVDLEGKIVTVAYDSAVASLDKMEEEIEEQGYHVV